jgi:hypothetical protein
MSIESSARTEKVLKVQRARGKRNQNKFDGPKSDQDCESETENSHDEKKIPSFPKPVADTRGSSEQSLQETGSPHLQDFVEELLGAAENASANPVL